MRNVAKACVFVILTFLAGCTSKRLVAPLTPDLHGPAGVVLFYATDRQNTGSTDFNKTYGSGRGERLSFGSLQISIREKFGPDKVTGQALQMQESDFLARLRGFIEQDPEHRLLIYVHGFNQTFADAALETAELVNALDFGGAVVFFSWPAHGGWTGLVKYPRDVNNADWAKYHFRHVLLELIKRSRATKTYLVAHSLGTRILTQALYEVAREISLPTIREIVIAAPDIDAQTFAEFIVPEIAEASPRITVYASKRDDALSFSKMFWGNVRLGESPHQIRGVETIDAGSFFGGLTIGLAHDYLWKPSIVDDLAALLQHGSGASARGLEKVVIDGAEIWRKPASSTSK